MPSILNFPVSFSNPVVSKPRFKWVQCDINKDRNHILGEELVFLLVTDKGPISRVSSFSPFRSVSYSYTRTAQHVVRGDILNEKTSCNPLQIIINLPTIKRIYESGHYRSYRHNKARKV